MASKYIRKSLGVMNDTIKIVAVALFSLVMLCILTQVFFRYVLKNPLVWIEELTRSLFIWMVFMGTAVAHQQMKHPNIDIFFRKIFKNKTEKVARIIADTILLVFLVLLLIYGANLTQALKFIKLPTSKVSLLYLYICIPISAFVMMINQIVFLIKDFVPQIKLN